MELYRIDIKKGNIKLPVIYTILKWIIGIYVISASLFLLYKSYYLIRGASPFFYDWLAIIINFLLVVVLTRQLLRIWDNTRYIIVANDHITFSQRFPWPCRVNSNRLKQIQFGYSSIRFITVSGKRYRFSLSNASQEDQAKLHEAMNAFSKKHNIDLYLPEL